MLTALNGYIDGNKVIVNENISGWQGRNVIVTILDSSRVVPSDNDKDKEKQKKRVEAAMQLSGLWADHDNSVSVEDMVRNMRKGRQFDI